MRIRFIAFMATLAASVIHTPTASACSLNPTAVISAPKGPYLSDNTSIQWKSIGSTANCGSITSYQWKLGSTVLSSSANFSYKVKLKTNQTDSTFTLRLVITNSAGRINYTERTVTVRDYQGQYYVKDHLGSPRVTVDGKGNVLSNADYYPFGSIMPGRSGNNGMSHDRTKFTGYLLEEEGEQDTYHAEARGYDPVIGRFTSRDPLVAKFPWVSPYVYVLNNPVNFFDPDGNEPFRVTVRTFIPFSGVMGFKGDNRGPSNSSNASYRTSHSVNVETNPAVSANPLTQDDGGKTGTTTLSENYRDQRNMFNDYMGIGGKANEGQAGGFTASVTRSDANSGDNAVISFVGSSSNPLLPGSPAIDYDFQISIMPGKVGEMPTVQVTGSHDGFPAYEINVQDKNGNAYQVYYHAPSSRWDIRKLLPPNDVEVKE